jgi:Ser/Thr protein kinase RdoA (MazF antagonist)
MLPIPELVRVSRLLDDSWHCELAEHAAARWDLSAAVFVRSSASHVFVARAPDGGAGVVLRMRPGSTSACRQLHRSARSAERLSAAGAPVVAAVRSSAGRLVETVDGCCVTAVAVAEGDVRDEDEADVATAWAWGAALAELHKRASAADVPGVPDMVDLATPSPATLTTNQPLDPALIAVAGEVAAGLATLPRDPSVHGLLHGDPELDNVVWTADGPVFVDLDDVRTGWWAADIGFALRAWGRAAEAPDLTAGIPAAFVEGYRSRRPVTEHELSLLPLFARTAALESLLELAPVLAHPLDLSWPAWALRLDDRVRTRAAELRAGLVP